MIMNFFDDLFLIASCLIPRERPSEDYFKAPSYGFTRPDSEYPDAKWFYLPDTGRLVCRELLDAEADEAAKASKRRTYPTVSLDVEGE
jgi:hypothetical protein